MLLPVCPFSTPLWLSCSPSVMVIYISENNKAEALEPREGWSGPQMSVLSPTPPCKGKAECSGNGGVVGRNGKGN